MNYPASAPEISPPSPPPQPGGCPFLSLLDQPFPPKIPRGESALRGFVRRILQTVKPSQARVRYDAAVNMWAVLDENNQPVRHFAYGYIESATLESITVREGHGCGARSTSIGVASGALREGVYAPDLQNPQNIG